MINRRKVFSLKNSWVSCTHASVTGSDSPLPYRIDFNSLIFLLSSAICINSALGTAHLMDIIHCTSEYCFLLLQKTIGLDKYAKVHIEYNSGHEVVRALWFVGGDLSITYIEISFSVRAVKPLPQVSIRRRKIKTSCAYLGQDVMLFLTDTTFSKTNH